MRTLALAAAIIAGAAAGVQAGFAWHPFEVDTRAGIEFTAPPAGALVAGPFDVKVAYDLGPGGEATMAELYIDEERYFARPILDGRARAECAFTVQSTDFADGTHRLTAVVYDAKAEKHIAARRVTFNNTGGGAAERGAAEPRIRDTTPPSVQIVRPTFGQTVWGKFDVLVAASDESGNPMVSIYIDGRNVLTSNSPPYKWMWDTRLIDNGAHEVGAVAYDLALNKAEANPVAVKIENEQLTTGPEDLLAGRIAAQIAPVITQIQSAVHGPLLGMIAQEQATHRLPRISPQAGETPEVRLGLEMPLDEEIPAAGAEDEVATTVPALQAQDTIEPVEPNWVVARREAVQVVLTRKASPAPQVALAPPLPPEEGEVEAEAEEVAAPAEPVVSPASPAKVAPTRPEIAQGIKEVELQQAAEIGTSGQAPAQPAAPPVESRPISPLKPQVATPVPKAKRTAMQTSRPESARPAVPVEPEEPAKAAERAEPVRVAQADIAPLIRAEAPVPKIAVYVDRRLVSFDVDPLIKSGYTITPIRHVIESLGGSVMWYSETRTVTADCRAKGIRLKIGDREALVDSKPFDVPLAPYITQGRTMVPLRFLGDALGLSLEYDRASGIVYASSGEAASQ
jgi:hypothetical protein